MSRRVNPCCALCGLLKTPNKSGRMMCKPCVNARLARIKPVVIPRVICGKCGAYRVRGLSGRLYCKACKLRAAGWEDASVAAWLAAKTKRVYEASAFDMFDAMVETMGLNQRCLVPAGAKASGGLKAGESLHSRKAI